MTQRVTPAQEPVVILKCYVRKLLNRHVHVCGIFPKFSTRYIWFELVNISFVFLIQNSVCCCNRFFSTRSRTPEPFCCNVCLKNATFYFMNVGPGTKKIIFTKKFSRANFDKLTKFTMKLLHESNRVLINKHIHHQTSPCWVRYQNYVPMKSTFRFKTIILTIIIKHCTRTYY